MTYNQILLSLIEKYNVKKIEYNNKNFSVFKNSLKKAQYTNLKIDEKLDNIKLLGKKLMVCKLEYVDYKDKETEKNFRIYATKKSISLLYSKDISQYFTDCTYKCLPSELSNKSSLLVLLGYNFKIDKFQLILIGILSHEDSDIYTEFYNFLKNTYKFIPKKISFDFGMGNIKGIQNAYNSSDNVTIIPCLFHLTQSWWRKASKIGLRKKKYIQDTKCLIFNLQLLPFMEKENAIKYYKLIKEYFSDSDEKYNNFYEYFEETWLALDSNIKPKFDFDLWAYINKFSFKGNKTKLISEDKLEEYVFFTNNATESFNNLINSCLSNNSKTSFTKFEEIIKFIFIRMEGEMEDENKNKGYEEKTLVSDILRELINLGFGKNGKIIKKVDLKKIKSISNINEIYKLSFEPLNENENSIDDNQE